MKGRLLNEWQIDDVVTLLARNEALFESTVIDLGMHTEQAVHDYKKQHGEEMLAKVANFREDVRPEVEKASRQILETSVPLYLQALTTFEVLHRLIGHMTMYFCQRGSRPNWGRSRGSWTERTPSPSPNGKLGGRTLHKVHWRRCRKHGQLLGFLSGTTPSMTALALPVTMAKRAPTWATDEIAKDDASLLRWPPKTS